MRVMFLHEIKEMNQSIMAMIQKQGYYTRNLQEQ